MTKTILFVDDEVDFKHLIEQKFKKKIDNRDYQFVFAHHGIEALSILESRTDIDIIVTDINMPEMDGIALLEVLQKKGKNYQTIVASAHDDLLNIRHAMNKGAFDFITKPIDFEDLEATIERTLSQAKAMKELSQTKARLIEIEKELDIARQIQSSLTPKTFEIEGIKNFLKISGIILPAKEVGGDFFDFFLLDKDHLALLIADVAGNNISAALFMAITKTLFRSCTSSSLSPLETLQKISQFLEKDNSSCMFVTVFYAILNVKTGQIQYAAAGHPSPFLITKSNQVYPFQAQISHLPLGIEASFLKTPISTQQNTHQLQPGDTLFLYTDGITETLNDRQEHYGVARLQTLLESKGPDIEKVVEDHYFFSSQIEQSDDIALLSITWH